MSASTPPETASALTVFRILPDGTSRSYTVVEGAWRLIERTFRMAWAVGYLRGPRHPQRQRRHHRRPCDPERCGLSLVVPQTRATSRSAGGDAMSRGDPMTVPSRVSTKVGPDGIHYLSLHRDGREWIAPVGTLPPQGDFLGPEWVPLAADEPADSRLTRQEVQSLVNLAYARGKAHAEGVAVALSVEEWVAHVHALVAQLGWTTDDLVRLVEHAPTDDQAAPLVSKLEETANVIRAHVDDLQGLLP